MVKPVLDYRVVKKNNKDAIYFSWNIEQSEATNIYPQHSVQSLKSEFNKLKVVNGKKTTHTLK